MWRAYVTCDSLCMYVHVSEKQWMGLSSQLWLIGFLEKLSIWAICTLLLSAGFCATKTFRLKNLRKNFLNCKSQIKKILQKSRLKKELLLKKKFYVTFLLTSITFKCMLCLNWFVIESFNIFFVLVNIFFGLRQLKV